jgi:predicted GNAT family acetyltransferase
MPLAVHRLDSVDAFLAAAGAFLVEREADHNLLFGISSAISASPELFASDPPLFLVVTDDDDRVVAASLRTPPNNQVISQADDPAAAAALADALVGETFPGVLAPVEVARHFVERWRERTGQAGNLAVSERIFRLERLIPPARPAHGRWRFIESRDRELIARWLLAFHAEATPGQPAFEDPLAIADRWVARVGRTGYAWEDGGAVVALVGAGGETPHGIRIGPVYTPPEHRGRGYATSLTAAATKDQLDRGRRFVFLFTDLANATSNRIYRSIGYEPVCDVDLWRFDERRAQVAGHRSGPLIR